MYGYLSAVEKPVNGSKASYSCEYSFGAPVLEMIRETKDVNKTRGYSLTYTSEEECKADFKYQYIVRVACDPDRSYWSSFEPTDC